MVIWTAILLCAAVAWIVMYLLNLDNQWRFRKIPGPAPRLIFGNMAEIRARMPPMAYTMWASKHGPIFRCFFLRQPVVVIQDIDLAHQVMVKHFKPMFHSASLATYDSVINTALDDLLRNLDAFAAQGQMVDMHRQLGNMTMQVIGQSALGVAFDSQKPGDATNPLVAAVHTIATTTSVNVWLLAALLLPKPCLPLVQACATAFPPASKRLVDKATATVWNTSVALIENAQKRLALPSKATHELDWLQRDVNNEYRIKGTTPTESSVIGRLLTARDKENHHFSDIFALYLLARHPAALEQLLREVDAFGRTRGPCLADMESLPYTLAVLKEAMRLYPPAGVVTREASSDIEIGSVLIPKGTGVQINIYGIQHDPRYFQEPYTFQPERWLGKSAGAHEPAAWMAFGAGPRRCPGEKLAVQEVAIGLVRLHQRFTFELAPGIQTGDLDLTFNVTWRPKGGLPMTLKPHKLFDSGWCRPFASLTTEGVALSAEERAQGPALLLNGRTLWASKYGPIFRCFFVRQPVVVIQDVNLAHQVMVKHFNKAFHDRPPILSLRQGKQAEAERSGMLRARGQYWAALRAGVQPMFHSASLATYDSLINTALDDLLRNLDAFAAQGQMVDMHRQLGKMTMQVIGQSAFGVAFDTQKPGDASPPLVAAVHTLVATSRVTVWVLAAMLLPKPCLPLIQACARAFPPASQRLAERASAFIWNTSVALVENAHKRLALPSKTTDDLDWLQRDVDNEYRIKGTTPTESSVIGRLLTACNRENHQFSDIFALYLLARHPAALEQLLHEVDAFGRTREPCLADMESLPYTSAVLKEAMRLYPPAGMTTREASSDIEVGSHLIPKGTWVHINIYGIQHDPRYFQDPYTFRPERWLGKSAGVHEPAAWMAFGAGPRRCPGEKLAVQEVAIALVRLHQRFTFELAPELQTGDLELTFNITFKPKGGLPMTLKPRA
eukprot:jgi/Astpho2/149/Aster-04614